MVMDFSITFIALSTIAEDFNISLREVTWVVLSSSLIITAFLLPFGRLSDLTGRKRFLMASMTLFALGALLSAFAPNFPALIGARVVMAIGGAMGQAVVLAMVTAVFPSNERGKILGMVTTAVSIGATLGPVIAGPILQGFGWRVIFIVLAVPTIAAVVAAGVILDDKLIRSEKPTKQGPYDWYGTVLSVIGLSLFVITIVNPFQFRFLSVPIIGGILVTVVMLVLFIWRERLASAPIIAPRLFRNFTFKWAAYARFFGFSGNSALFFLMPIFIQSFLGYTPSIAGLMLFVNAFGIGASAQFSGRLSDKFGYRRFSIIGLGSLTLLSLFFAFIGDGISLWVLGPALFAHGASMGLWMPPNMSASIGVVDRKDYGSVTAFVNLVRNVGSIISQALVVAIIAGVVASRGLEVNLSALGEGTAEPGLRQAFLVGWRAAFIVLAGINFLAFLSSVRLPGILVVTPPAPAAKPEVSQ